MPKLAKFFTTIDDTYTVTTSFLTQQDSTIDPTHAVITSPLTQQDSTPAVTLEKFSGSRRRKNRSCNKDAHFFLPDFLDGEPEQIRLCTLGQQIKKYDSLDEFFASESASNMNLVLHGTRRSLHVTTIGYFHCFVKEQLDAQKDIDGEPVIQCPHKGSSQNSHCKLKLTLSTVAYCLRKCGRELDHHKIPDSERTLHTELVQITEQAIVQNHKKNGDWFCCPNRSCSNSSGFADTYRSDRQRATCSVCYCDFCAQCSTVHESHEPCFHQSKVEKCFEIMQSIEKYQDVNQFESDLGTKYQICPGSTCVKIYSKDDHCDHVTCAECSTQFCFGCGSRWVVRTGDTHEYQHIVLLPRHDKVPPGTRGRYLCTTFIINQARSLLRRHNYTESDSWIVHAVFSIRNIFQQFSQDEISTLHEIEINIGVTDEIRSDPLRLADYQLARIPDLYQSIQHRLVEYN